MWIGNIIIHQIPLPVINIGGLPTYLTTLPPVNDTIVPIRAKGMLVTPIIQIPRAHQVQDWKINQKSVRAKA